MCVYICNRSITKIRMILKSCQTIWTNYSKRIFRSFSLFNPPYNNNKSTTLTWLNFIHSNNKSCSSRSCSSKRRCSSSPSSVYSVGVSVEHQVGWSCDSCLNNRKRQRNSLRFFLNNLNNNFNQISLREFSTKLKMPSGKPFERLPKTVVPKHYILTLIPDLKLLTFQGDVSIEIEVVNETNEIVLNAIDLEIEKTVLKDTSNNVEKQPDDTIFSTDDEIVTLKFLNKLTKGLYELKMKFTGQLNDKMKGLYRSKYTNQNGEECYAAVTQFEATDARRCFPCWDEPALKATFDINLIVPKHLVALSNMPIKSINNNNNRNNNTKENLIEYNFKTTPIMSTYLVCVVVGEYDYVEDQSTDGVLVRVYTPKGKKEQGRFALEVATKVLPFYKDYFNIAYPLPKIDLIAIADFSAGAMENWGLVTYRETCLLVDPENTSAVQKQWIALVVGHELAHQWFGNLVTMEWWTHLWLNEGYASFVEYLCVDHLFPEYDIWTQFVNDTYIKALELDSLKNSHPIEVPVGHPSEIDEIFDDISYNKGASVIRMLHNYIGDEDFRKGMNLYLTKHQYKNTFTEDLWDALEEASKKPVRKVMSTWTKQMGFPVIKVSSKYTKQQEQDGILLKLSQRKYTADGSIPSDEYLWMIPITIATSKKTEKPINTVLTTKESEIFIPNIGPNDWIKINPGTVGFYRTQYESELLEKFIPQIKDKTLPPLDRLGLLDDLFAMVQAGHTNTVEVLKLLEAFEDETNYTVWSSISNILGKLNLLLSYTDCFELFTKYQKRILSKVYGRLGWNPSSDEKHLDKLLRSLVLNRLAWLDDDATIQEGKKRFAAHMDSSQVLPADLRSACYKIVLRADGEKAFNILMDLYKTVDLHEEKDRISRALGAAKDPEILKRVLKFSISDEVRSQDTVFVIIGVALSRTGRDLAWRFFIDNWKLFEDRYKGHLLTRLVKYLAENFASESAAQEVEQFFKEHEIAGTERTVQQAVETIRLNSAWLARDTDAIRKYLSSN